MLFIIVFSCFYVYLFLYLSGRVYVRVFLSSVCVYCVCGVYRVCVGVAVYEFVHLRMFVFMCIKWNKHFMINCCV